MPDAVITIVMILLVPVTVVACVLTRFERQMKDLHDKAKAAYELKLKEHGDFMGY